MRHELEALTRAGKFADVERLLRTLKYDKVKREDALPIANIAGRVGQFRVSLRLLNPIIRGDQALRHPPTSEELSQYANALRKLGALIEAKEMLERINIRSCPKAGFELALCHIAEWDYALAIPVLQDYLGTFTEPNYAVSVGQINLLAAFIHENRLEEAQTLTLDLERNVQREEMPLLFSNLQELTAQLEIKSGRLAEALRRLEGARVMLGAAPNSLPALLIHKWIAVARSQQAGHLLPELSQVRGSALRLNHWETVRDCDFNAALLTRDEAALTRLYFCTPFPSFRKKIASALGSLDRIPEVFVLEGRGGARCFDLSLAQIRGEAVALTPGQSMHRLLIALCRDSYRPLQLLHAFSLMFPGEHLDSLHSPNRIHQVFKRLRAWIEEHALPLQLEEVTGSYRLALIGDLGIEVPREPLPMSQSELQFLRLQQLMQKDDFSAREMMAISGLSKSALHRLLQWAIKERKIVALGHAAYTHYKIAA